MMSRRQMARVLGVSEAAVRKAIRSGRIHALPDGTLDPDAVLAAWPAREAAVPPEIREAANLRAEVRTLRTENARLREALLGAQAAWRVAGDVIGAELRTFIETFDGRPELQTAAAAAVGRAADRIAEQIEAIAERLAPGVTRLN